MNICKNLECNNATKNNNIYCSSKCRNIYVNKYMRSYDKLKQIRKERKNKKEELYYLNPKKCLCCNEIILFDKITSKFCNHSCSAKFINKTRVCNERKPFSEKALKNIQLATYKKLNINGKCSNISYFNCIICNKLFITKGIKPNKLCSNKCTVIHRQNIAFKHNLGGELNFIKYYYKEIQFDSSWEVEIAKYLDKKNIIWIRTKKIYFEWLDINNVKRKYHPYFYLPDYNVYLDPKNPYNLKQDEYKIKKVIETHNIELIVGGMDIIKEYINKIGI